MATIEDNFTSFACPRSKPAGELRVQTDPAAQRLEVRIPVRDVNVSLSGAIIGNLLHGRRTLGHRFGAAGLGAEQLVIARNQCSTGPADMMSSQYAKCC